MNARPCLSVTVNRDMSLGAKHIGRAETYKGIQQTFATINNSCCSLIIMLFPKECFCCCKDVGAGLRGFKDFSQVSFSECII